MLVIPIEDRLFDHLSHVASFDPSTDGLRCESFAACEQPPPAGEGLFGEPVTFARFLASTDVSLDDLDGDGSLDLAAANGLSDEVSILLGLGDGTFTEAVDYAAGENPISVTAGDLDGDGALDLVVTNNIPQRGSPSMPEHAQVSVLIGVGDGTFCDAVTYRVGREPWSAALGDLDGDGALDLVTANNTGSNDVSILLSR